MLAELRADLAFGNALARRQFAGDDHLAQTLGGDLAAITVFRGGHGVSGR